MYQGVYHGSKKHEPDLVKVLNRSWDTGMDKMIITGGSLVDSKKAIEMSHIDCKYICLFIENYFILQRPFDSFSYIGRRNLIVKILFLTY